MGARLEDKVAIITGSARGIGKAIATVFSREGAKVVIADTLEAEGKATAEAINASGGKAIFQLTDMTDSAGVNRLVSTALEHFGQLDIACHNAGIYPQNLIEDISDEEWDKVLGVNLRGLFILTKACIPHMKARKYGRILATSSITGPRVSQPYHAHYATSKSGINGFLKSAAVELAKYGITVNGVEPGNIATEAWSENTQEFIQGMENAVPMHRLGKPEEIGQAMLFLASDEANYITGTTIIVDGGQTLPESEAGIL